MSTPTVTAVVPNPSNLTRRQLHAALLVVLLASTPLLIWPALMKAVLATDFLPHLYCYLKNPALVWTHVAADTFIGISYLAISVTLAYLVKKSKYDIPFPWMFLAFGLFIIACGGTHFMEVVTVWIPVYVFSAAVKVFTAGASVATAVIFPFTVPKVLNLVEQAKVSEHITSELRASEERKEALLREVHHRVKNNLAVICSLFYLQSTHTNDEKTAGIFSDMENRVHSMALVHESLYSSENLARIDFTQYAQILAADILASHGKPTAPVRLKTDMEPVIMGVDLALPCGLILNELVSNALKHGFPDGEGGEIKLTLRCQPGGRCILSVEDSGVGIPDGLDINTNKSLGLKLVRLLTQQIRGSFDFVKSSSGTSAHLQFMVDQNAR